MDQLSLYKYIAFNAPSLNGSGAIQNKRQSCFENGEIWYPQANKLNDPFDCNPDFQLPVNDEEKLEKTVNSLSKNELKFVEGKIGISTKEELLVLLKTPNVMNTAGLAAKSKIPVDFIHRSVFVGYLGALFFASISSIGVLSLTEDPFNLRMWAHYGGNSTGVCLEFERNSNNILGSKSTKKVEYVAKRPKIMLHDRHKEIEEMITTKSHIWKYEKEWRNCQREGDKAYPFPGKVRRIIFGLNCHKDTVEVTKNIFGAKVEYEEILLSGDYSIQSDHGCNHSLSQVDLEW